MSSFARTVHVLLLGIWLGASILFVGAAQKVSSMVDSRHLAGDLISAILALIDGYGVIAGPVILVTLFAGWMPLAVPLRARGVGAMAMIGAILVSRYWTAPAISEAKAEMGMRLEHMSPAHPLMQQYQSMHTLSSALMMIHLVICFFMLISAVRASRPRRSFGGIEL